MISYLFSTLGYQRISSAWDPISVAVWQFDWLSCHLYGSTIRRCRTGWGQGQLPGFPGEPWLSWCPAEIRKHCESFQHHLVWNIKQEKKNQSHMTYHPNWVLKAWLCKQRERHSLTKKKNINFIGQNFLRWCFISRTHANLHLKTSCGIGHT